MHKIRESSILRSMIKRTLQPVITERLGRGKVIVLVGARQVGKTTLTQELLKKYKPARVLVYNGDNLEAQKLSKLESSEIKLLVEGHDCLLIDEAHKVNRIGDITKSLVDEFGDKLQIILTGSSTINLVDRTTEALTGRKRLFKLFPISAGELGLSNADLLSELKKILIYGLYPEVVNETRAQAKQEALLEITESSLYRDVLDVTGTRASGDLVALLRYLANNIGQTLSINEASLRLSIDRRTIDRYIELLAKSFVVFPLLPYSRKGSLRRSYKIYFWDVGVRNALAEDFSSLDTRADRDMLWQNFVIAERLKQVSYTQQLKQHYFWRSYDGAEVDLVEVVASKLHGYRISYDKRKLRQSRLFNQLNPVSQTLITPYNFSKDLLG